MCPAFLGLGFGLGIRVQGQAFGVAGAPPYTPNPNLEPESLSLKA